MSRCPISHCCLKSKVTQLSVKSTHFPFFNNIWTCFHLSRTSDLFLFLILLLSSQSSSSADGPKWLLHLSRPFPTCPKGSLCVDEAVREVSGAIMDFRGQSCSSGLALPLVNALTASEKKTPVTVVDIALCSWELESNSQWQEKQMKLGNKWSGSIPHVSNWFLSRGQTAGSFSPHPPPPPRRLLPLVVPTHWKLGWAIRHHSTTITSSTLLRSIGLSWMPEIIACPW